jgi:hypothetical protein
VRERKNLFSLLLLLAAGIVLGGFLGRYLANYPSWGWLDYGKTFGMTSPFTLELQIISITFGISFKITIAGIIGMALGLFVYKKM